MPFSTLILRTILSSCLAIFLLPLLRHIFFFFSFFLSHETTLFCDSGVGYDRQHHRQNQYQRQQHPSRPTCAANTLLTQTLHMTSYIHTPQKKKMTANENNPKLVKKIYICILFNGITFQIGFGPSTSNTWIWPRPGCFSFSWNSSSSHLTPTRGIFWQFGWKHTPPLLFLGAGDANFQVFSVGPSKRVMALWICGSPAFTRILGPAYFACNWLTHHLLSPRGICLIFLLLLLLNYWIIWLFYDYQFICIYLIA